ncbi:hypothetical protein VP1G_10608 [Cytospora mali]|uniref:Uncharacterized protein n=1 Tax=Cytospora mali TaxID=578113 RepID=A0A194UQP0_CYTMA|nr:hypothetical protein VP1G_10608 [Valsa mali var. pyri (nom. inval.)]
MGAPRMPQWMSCGEGVPVGATGPTVPVAGADDGTVKLLTDAVLMGVTVGAMTRDVGRDRVEEIWISVVGRLRLGNDGIGSVENVGSGSGENVTGGRTGGMGGVCWLPLPGDANEIGSPVGMTMEGRVKLRLGRMETLGSEMLGSVRREVGKGGRVGSTGSVEFVTEAKPPRE